MLILQKGEYLEFRLIVLVDKTGEFKLLMNAEYHNYTLLVLYRAYEGDIRPLTQKIELGTLIYGKRYSAGVDLENQFPVNANLMRIVQSDNYRL